MCSSAAFPRPSRPAAASDGGGGAAGRRGGANALLPNAAVHGRTGAAARLPTALVPPHRQHCAAGRAAAEGTQPCGKAGAGPGRAGRAGGA